MVDRLIKMTILLSLLFSVTKITYSMDSISNLPNKTEFGIRGDNPDLTKLANVNIPPSRGEKIPTLNKTGYMKTELDEFSSTFVDNGCNDQTTVLELGASYGLVSKKCLAKGSVVIANDICDKHLAALYYSVKYSQLSKLFLDNNKFPEDTNFPINSISSILLSRMAHFLEGDEIEVGFRKLYNWLKPGGKLYFITLSPHHHLLKEKFLPIYRTKELNDEKWPGIIRNMKYYNPKESNEIPDFLHVFDTKVIDRELKKVGFRIETIKLFDYSNNNSQGQGYLGCIAVKD